MKSKENILEKLQNENPHSIPVFKAMDEYAKEQAIAFAKWCLKEGWSDFDGVDMWINIGKTKKTISTVELYEKFKSASQTLT